MIESELELPGLFSAEPEPPVTGGAAIHVRLGRVPESLHEARDRGGCFQTAPGKALIAVPGVGRYLVLDGETVWVEPTVDAEPAALQLFLLGVALGVLLHQRGHLVLHASAVAADAGVLAFAGPSAAGKSVLAAAAIKRGLRLVGDELCVVTPGPDGSAPQVLPGYPFLYLWRRALDRLESWHEALPRARRELDKYRVPHLEAAVRDPQPLRRLVVLRSWNREDLEISELRGFQRMRAFLDNTYREPYLKGLALRKQRQRLCSEIAPHVPVRSVSWPQRWGDLDDVLDGLLQDLTS